MSLSWAKKKIYTRKETKPTKKIRQPAAKRSAAHKHKHTHSIICLLCDWDRRQETKPHSKRKTKKKNSTIIKRRHTKRRKKAHTRAMKAVWNENTTHAESVYCMCSVNWYWVLQRGRLRVSYRGICVVWCIYTVLCMVLNNAHLYKQQHRFNTTHSLLLLMLMCCCCCCCCCVPLLLLLSVRTHFSVGLFIFFAHACI